MKKPMALLAFIAICLAGCSTTNDRSASSPSGSPDVDVATTQVTAVPSNAADPTVLPVTGGSGEASGGMRFDVSQFGYQEHEYFFEGTAKPYQGDVAPAPYRSRMIVWTPTDSERFNGTTVVEWAHVSDYGQFELTVDVNTEITTLEHEGFAFALVSAEEGGICDVSPTGCSGMSLQGADPDRYSTLHHPGDPYSFDIFSQAMQAIKHPTGLAPLGDLDTNYVIAEGFQASIDKWYPVGDPEPEKSTSPFSVYGALNAYLSSGADADARVADAFLIDGGAPAIQPEPYRVPTLYHLDESAVRRTPITDGPNHVTWEVVGASHADRWTSDHFRLPSSNPAPKLTRDEEELRRDKFDNYGQIPTPGADICAPGKETGTPFPRRFTSNAALVALRNWLETGTPAPTADRIERVATPPGTPTKKLARDAAGNAIGGLRSPVITVPVGSYNGEECVSAGTMIPLPATELAARYPTHQSYVTQLLAATNEAVEQGFLLCQDAETLMRKASESQVGGTDPYTAEPACA